MKGKTIHGYTVIKLLGKGGMASVWYAENSLGKSAAIKVMHKKFADDETTKERFLKEAKAMMKLKSPYIRDVYDQGTFEGLPFILLEYLIDTV